MGIRYVSPETEEHARTLFDLGLLYMNQDTSPERTCPAWVRAANFIVHYIPQMYDPAWNPDPDKYIKGDIGYLLED